MKIGEVWVYTFGYKSPHYVKIDNMDVLSDFSAKHEVAEDYWISFEYCSKDGDLGEEENRSGDSMLRSEFVKKYKKVYE